MLLLLSVLWGCKVPSKGPTSVCASVKAARGWDL